MTSLDAPAVALDDPTETSAATHPVRMLAKQLSLAQLRLRMRQIRRERCPAGGHLQLGQADGPALYLLERGSLQLDELGPWGSRQTLLLPSGGRLVARNPGRQALAICAAPLRLSIGGISDPLTMLALPACCGRADERSLALWAQLMVAGEATRQGDQWARPRARGLVQLLLVQAIEAGLAAGSLRFHPEHRQPLWLHQALSLIEQRLADPALDVAALAAVAGLSPSRFSARFRELLDQSPKAFLLQRRIASAQDLLRRRPELSVAAVAEACGYRDQFHFSAQFKRATGHSPSGWRALGAG